MNLRSVIRRAWDEFKITRQIASGSAEAYVAVWRIPGWFKQVELGLGQGEGPSILWWHHNLTEHNRRAEAALAVKVAPEGPVIKKSPRLNAMRVRQALLSTAKKAGMTERNKMRALRQQMAA